jgi:hypothetical protein
MKVARFSSTVSHGQPVAAFCAALAVGLVAFASSAHARNDLVIHDSRTPIGYDLELEPHLVLGTNPPGPGIGSGVGIGLRGSVVVAPEGFIRNVNDSVAVGVGLDFGHYTGSWAIQGYRDQCLHFEPGPNGTSICTEVTSNGGTYNYVYIPVVMQWNFWFTRQWSAFAEPGLNLYFLGNHGFDVSPAAYVGGRFQIADRITLTARLGYPTLSFGVSFML